MNNTKKIIGLIIALIMFGALIAGATYAALTTAVNTTNQAYNANSLCFLIDYNINNTDNTQDISGTLFPSGTIDRGLNGRVGLKTSSQCTLNGLGTLKLHINDTTSSALTTPAASYCEDRSTLEPISGITTEAACKDESVNGRWRGYGDSYCESKTTLERLDYPQSTCASHDGTWKSGGSPLKYAVYNSIDMSTPVAVGRIENSNDITLKDNIMITEDQKYYYIYIWLDGYLTDSTYTELPFSASISASATQTEYKVPPAYQQVEYVQSGGSQYINTGVLTKQTLKFKSEFSTTTSSKTLFGARTSTSADSIAFGYFTTNSSYVGFGGATTQYSVTINPVDGKKHIVELDNTSYKIDNTNQTINNRSTLTNSYNIYLGTWNNAGTADNRMFVGKIYSFSIADNSLMIRNFVPCKNKSSNTIGLYDVIGDKFYTNNGTGSFTAGPNV